MSWKRAVILRDVVPALVIDTPEALGNLLAGPPAEIDPAPRCRPMHFTSGTTGRPNGVWSGLLDSDMAAALACEERVCAAYVGDVDEQALRILAETRLAPPKRPESYEQRESLPRTATGKVRSTQL